MFKFQFSLEILREGKSVASWANGKITLIIVNYLNAVKKRFKVINQISTGK